MNKVPVIVVYKPNNAAQPSHQGTGYFPPQQLHKELIKAARKNDPQALAHLFRQGVTADYFGLKEHFVIHLAAYYGSHQFLKTLSTLLSKPELQTMINAKNEYGSTPLHSAVKKGEPAMVELLLKLGADPQVEDNRFRTPLELSRRLGNTKTTTLLKAASKPQASEPQDRHVTVTQSKRSKSQTQQSVTSNLNPFAKVFSPKSVSSHQLATQSAEYSDEEEIFKHLPSAAALLSETVEEDQEKGFEPSIPSALRRTYPSGSRLNIFTGEWGDPFVPPQNS